MKKGQQYSPSPPRLEASPSPRSIERAAGTLDWVDNFKPPPTPSKEVLTIVQQLQQNYAIGADLWKRDKPGLDFQQYAQDRLRAYRAEWDDPRSTIKVDQPEFAKYAGFRAGQDQLKAIADVADSRTIGDIAGDSVKAAARGISRLVHDATLFTAPLNPVMLYQDAVDGAGTAQRIALQTRQSSDDFYNNAQSDGLKAQKARFADRSDRSVLGTVQAAIDNPGVIGDIAAEQTGPALLTGLGGKALQTTGASARALSAFGLGSEMAQSGVSTYGQALQDGAKPGDALLASTQSMLTTGLIGKVLGDGSRLARALEHAPGKYSVGARAADMLVREPLSEAAQEVLADNLATNLVTGKDAFDNWQESAVLGATGGLGQSLALHGVGKGMAPGRQQADMTRVLEPVVDLQPGEMQRSPVSDPQAPSPVSAHAISNADGLPGVVAGEQPVAAGVVPVWTMLPLPDEQHVFEPGQHAEPDPSIPAQEPDLSAVAQATRPDSLARESENAAANGIEMPADALTAQARVSAADHDQPIVEPVIEPGSESELRAYRRAQQRRRDAGLYVMRQLEAKAANAEELAQRQAMATYQRALGMWLDADARLQKMAPLPAMPDRDAVSLPEMETIQAASGSMLPLLSAAPPATGMTAQYGAVKVPELQPTRTMTFVFPERVLNRNGEPFSRAALADIYARAFGLSATHRALPVGQGFVLQQVAGETEYADSVSGQSQQSRLRDLLTDSEGNSLATKLDRHEQHPDRVGMVWQPIRQSDEAAYIPAMLEADSKKDAYPVSRIDISDRFKGKARKNGTASYVYLDPRASHGLIVEIDKQGVLGFDIYADKNLSAQLGTGTDMFASAMKLFENEGRRVTAIRGFWRPGQGSDNYRQYTENLAKGMDPKQAAANTWTGKIAARFGYPVVSEPEDYFGNIRVIFTP